MGHLGVRVESFWGLGLSICAGFLVYGSGVQTLKALNKPETILPVRDVAGEVRGAFGEAFCLMLSGFLEGLFRVL